MVVYRNGMCLQKNAANPRRAYVGVLAERVGFEPTVRF